MVTALRSRRFDHGASITALRTQLRARRLSAVSTRTLLLLSLATGLAILVAFAIQILLVL